MEADGVRGSQGWVEKGKGGHTMTKTIFVAIAMAGHNISGHVLYSCYHARASQWEASKCSSRSIWALSINGFCAF